MAKNRERQRANRRLKNERISLQNGSRINDPTAFMAVESMNREREKKHLSKTEAKEE